MRSRLLASLGAVALALPLFAASASFALGVTVWGSLEVDAADSGFDIDVANPAAVPESGTLTAAASGTAGSASYDLAGSGFSFGFDAGISGTPGANAFLLGLLYFVPDADVDYVFDGSFTATDVDGRHVTLTGSLYDDTAGTSLFSSYQTSDNTANESFTLGLQGGDLDNILSGSPTGTLLAGHTYSLYLFAEIENTDAAYAQTATATGALNLTFVPEPGIGLLGIAGLLGLAARRPVLG
jgi:hypothetical protein